MPTPILNSADIHAGWTMTPKPGRQNVITFNGGSATSLPFLVDTVSIGFSRPTQRKFFLNSANALYINGFGSGSLELGGLFGEASSFKQVFGKQDGCKVFTATLKVLSLDACDDNSETFKSLNSFTLEGIMPLSISIGSTVDQSGVLYQNGSASFVFTSLKVD